MSDDLLHKLIKIGVIQYGTFTLKSNQKSDIYCDLKKIISYPKILEEICYELGALIKDKNNIILGGVPMGAVPYAIVISILYNIPGVMIREHEKDYGTKKVIEGDYQGQDLVLIEDVITTGESLVQTLNILENENINVKEIIVIVDRDGGGVKNLSNRGYKITSLFTLNQLRPTSTIKQSIKQYPNKPLVNKINKLITEKKTNIILSIDNNIHKSLNMIYMIGNDILGIKLHWDIYNLYEYDIIYQEIMKLKQIFKLIIIDDRKLSDIGYIVKKQLKYIKSRADIVTAHGIAGESMISTINDENIGILLIYQLSTKDNIIDYTYSDKVRRMGMKYDNVIGFITQEKVADGFLNFSPGVNLTESSDKFCQSYNTPKYMQKQGIDIFIIGRGIFDSDDPIKACIKYKEQCYLN